MKGFSGMTAAQLEKHPASRGGSHVVSSGRKEKGTPIHELKTATPPRESQGANQTRIYIPVTPVAKPRMTRADKWKKRPCVLRYRTYCDALRESWGTRPFPAAGAHLVFHLPMPKSWSKKKRAATMGQGHQQKPDVDNLCKAVLDALHDDDSHIYDLQMSKYWSDGGYIEVFINQTLAKAA